MLAEQFAGRGQVDFTLLLLLLLLLVLLDVLYKLDIWDQLPLLQCALTSSDSFTYAPFPLSDGWGVLVIAYTMVQRLQLEINGH